MPASESFVSKNECCIAHNDRIGGRADIAAVACQLSNVSSFELQWFERDLLCQSQSLTSLLCKIVSIYLTFGSRLGEV